MTSFRSFSAWSCVTFLLLGLLFVALGVGVRLVPSSASGTSWISIVAGVGVALFALFGLGVALGRNDRPICPHCSKEISVTVSPWTGRVGAAKSDSSLD